MANPLASSHLATHEEDPFLHPESRERAVAADDSPASDTSKTSVVRHDDPNVLPLLLRQLERLMSAAPLGEPITIVGIGSDRTTGDCLGPLVGDYLADLPQFQVLGTLDDPVHAANMAEIVSEITGFTIAVDAALGSPVGGISIRGGSLAPGAAFGRDLPHVGDIAISGLMCESGPLGFERLRSVRLGFVRRVAHTIAIAVATAAQARTTHLRLPAPRAARGDVLLDLATIERANARRDDLPGRVDSPFDRTY